MRVPSRLSVVSAFAAIYLVWGSTYLAILFAIRAMPPLLMAGTRFVLSGVIIYAAARLTGAPRPVAGHWRNAAIVGVCLLFFGNGGVTIAEQWVPSGLASLIVATVPIDIAILGWLTGVSKRPTIAAWLGLIGGIAGVGILVGPVLTGGSASGHFLVGVAVLLFGSLVWSAGSLYSRCTQGSPSLFLSSGQQMITGGIALFAGGLIHGEWKDFQVSRLTPQSLGAFVYLIFIGAIVGYTAYFWLLQHCEPAKVATYAYVNPIVAVLLGAFFADERLTLRTLVAAAMIVGSVALVITAEQMKAKRGEARRASLAEAAQAR